MKDKQKKFDEIIKELRKIRNPQVKEKEASLNFLKNKIIEQIGKENINFEGVIPISRKAYFELTTARNRNLINIEEQNILRKTVVGFFGLSVGSHAAITWMLESRADVVKIADPDKIAPTNLNRIKVGWGEIGSYKTDIVKRDLIAMNPFTTVYDYVNVEKKDVEVIFNKTPRLDVVIDEIDSLKDKVLLRKLAKENKIPLISAADVGDNVVVDVERYDINPNLPIFLGRVKDLEKINFDKLTDKEKKKLIIQLVGFEKNSEKMINSLFAIGGSIVTWPQLGATATIAGGVITTLIKKIILKEKVESGRYYISLDDIFTNFGKDRKTLTSITRKVNRIKKLMNSDEV